MVMGGLNLVIPIVLTLLVLVLLVLLVVIVAVVVLVLLIRNKKGLYRSMLLKMLNESLTVTLDLSVPFPGRFADSLEVYYDCPEPEDQGLLCIISRIHTHQ